MSCVTPLIAYAETASFAVLKKGLKNDGWELREEKISTYPDTFFPRPMIPDIILQKENKIMVFDAKYKRMVGEYNDVDRADFFQIHTYMQYFDNIIMGGLLYPLSKPLEKNVSENLFGHEGNNIGFIIDGVQIDKINDIDAENDIATFEKNFVKRIKGAMPV